MGLTSPCVDNNVMHNQAQVLMQNGLVGKLLILVAKFATIKLKHFTCHQEKIHYNL